MLVRTAGSSCSQMRTTIQPATSRALVVSRSRSLFRASFAAHHSMRLAAGLVGCRGQECQKRRCAARAAAVADRPITHREAARLQCSPDEFTVLRKFGCLNNPAGFTGAPVLQKACRVLG